MYDRHSRWQYRKLTTEEAQVAERAVLWLARKRLKAQTIALLTEQSLDRESKTLYAKVELPHIIYYRKIRFADTPLDLYLTEVLPCLKVERWLFPNQGWTGRNPSFGFHVHVQDVENFLRKQARIVLTKRKRYDNIELSTKKLNIQNQLMVGRRIALRA